LAELNRRGIVGVGNGLKRMRILGLVIGLGLVGGAALRGEDDIFVRDVQPLLKQHCLECHRGAKAKGGVNLAAFTNTASLYANPKLWETSVRQIEDRQMPPKDEEQPAEAARIKLAETLTHLLDNPAPEFVVRDPGAKVIHRLNRTEYNHTVRDLLGVDTRPADRFPADGGGGGGFDNNADTLFVPPILMEKYLLAAEEVLAAAEPGRLIHARPVWFRRERSVAADNVAWFARRAFRRPVEADEVERLLKLYDRARAKGHSFELALKSAYKAVLVSPSFLFRGETEQTAGAAWRINPHELATRLSYFLWSSMPDEELFRAADSGTLADAAELERQVRRMLRDPKARALAENFTGQWLGTKRLHTTVSPDRRRFPQYTDALRDAMAAEPIEFFGSLLAEDASLLRLLDADYTFANADLGKFYGLTNVTATNLVRVPLTDRNRGGIIGMAAVLTQTSYPLRTSPVLRGRWILEEVLGTPPPPPPPLVATLPADDKVKEGLTFRQRLEKHRENKNCAACHDRLDPMGFALENFDAIGRWRTEVDKQPVDARGVLTNGEEVNGPVELKAALLKRKQLFLRHLTEKMLAYALGRGLEHYDVMSVKEIAERVAKSDYRATALVVEVARSYPFLWRRGEGATPSPPTAGTAANE
jgi:mono/diheme cytochrome c family protein